ncbi:MAG: tRNA preQ1(34) S-adenosylmethionine ribosyltransferase-isomerase QueA [Syntrophobacterales bacterium]|nr:tRNA preQ1(34) S-adenosylmethionine ribosyltransferase-isomerase QueA [Syntrophobacterales bacterium]
MRGEEEITYDIQDYDYELPEELIALEPSEHRDESRLLVLHRSTGGMEHTVFKEVVRYFRPGDLLVLNDTKVVPARLYGQKETGGRVELLLLDPFISPEIAKERGYECLVKTSKPLKPGMVIKLLEPIKGNPTNQEVIVQLSMEGRVRIKLPNTTWNIMELLEKYGEVPLPPYIRRSKIPGLYDRDRYQTVYARHPGAIAAPTAGFHFTEEILDRLKQLGVRVVFVTLHVGYGTFEPMKVEDVREHKMHSEWCEVSEDTARSVEETKRLGGRVIAVGTTVVRVLEGIVSQCKSFPYQGFCDCYIVPGYEFKIVDAMITNFHLPKSTLVLLVSAFAGRKLILTAYREAIARRYKFYSYGDAMFII